MRNFYCAPMHCTVYRVGTILFNPWKAIHRIRLGSCDKRKENDFIILLTDTGPTHTQKTIVLVTSINGYNFVGVLVTSYTYLLQTSSPNKFVTSIRNTCFKFTKIVMSIYTRHKYNWFLCFCVRNQFSSEITCNQYLNLKQSLTQASGISKLSFSYCGLRKSAVEICIISDALTMQKNQTGY